MLKKSLCLAACLFSILSGVAGAQDRYQNRPPVIVSPDLTAPWVMQLTGERVVYRQQVPRPPESGLSGASSAAAPPTQPFSQPRSRAGRSLQSRKSIRSSSRR